MSVFIIGQLFGYETHSANCKEIYKYQVVLLCDRGFSKFYSRVFVKEKQKSFVKRFLCPQHYAVHFTYMILFRLQEVW